MSSFLNVLLYFLFEFGLIMIIDEKPYITHSKTKYRCYLAGYTNPVQHKWSFVIDGIDSEIYHGTTFEFLGLELTVCLTCRRDAQTTLPFNNVTGKETYIEAWIV